MRNVRQVCEGGVRRFGMSRETVRSATWKPSFSSSPWILGAPQRGLAAVIRVTRAAISGLTGGRPRVGRPESLVQCSRNRRSEERRVGKEGGYRWAAGEECEIEVVGW